VLYPSRVPRPEGLPRLDHEREAAAAQLLVDLGGAAALHVGRPGGLGVPAIDDQLDLLRADGAVPEQGREIAEEERVIAGNNAQPVGQPPDVPVSV
jgi:hypothetical protein